MRSSDDKRPKLGGTKSSKYPLQGAHPPAGGPSSPMRSLHPVLTTSNGYSGNAPTEDRPPHRSGGLSATHTAAGSGARLVSLDRKPPPITALDPPAPSRRDIVQPATDGYYFVASSDDDDDEEDNLLVNSSFSDTAPCSTRRQSLMGDADSEHSRPGSARGDEDNNNNNNNNSADDHYGDHSNALLDEHMSDYDEEDEEQAVVAYMDSAVFRQRGSSGHNNADDSADGGEGDGDDFDGEDANMTEMLSTARVRPKLTTPHHMGGTHDSIGGGSTTNAANRNARISPGQSAVLGGNNTSVTSNNNVQVPRPINETSMSTAGSPQLPTPPQRISRLASFVTRHRRRSLTSADNSAATTPLAPPPLTPPTSTSPKQQQQSGLRGVGEWAADVCRTLSLHDAFFLNEARTMWLVDDRVLAKCLEYVRLMGYEHPLLKVDRAAGQPSMWSPTSAIASPIVQVEQKQMSAARSAPCLGPTMGASSSQSLQSLPHVVGPQYKLRTTPPTCAADKAHISPLFMTYAEAMRWVLEQEYVIGVILLCCARYDPAMPSINPSGSRAPRASCLPTNTHPIQWVGQYIMQQHPQWGDWTAFTRVWETQVRLAMCPSAPSHQRTFPMPEDDITFHSDMESGNLLRVERGTEPLLYYVWLEPDAGSDKRIWFRFGVSGVPEGRTLRIRLMNASPHTKLYRMNHMTPVWRDGWAQPNWGPVDQCAFRTINDDLEAELSFSILSRSPHSTMQIAFCAPYSYSDLLCHLCNWHGLVKTSRCGMRFEERVLCRSPDGRKLHLLIITSATVPQPAGSHVTGRARTKKAAAKKNPSAGKSQPAAARSNNNAATTMEEVRGPYANFASGKKVILISGRVHPGEVTASHGLHGIISFLLSSDPRAVSLRDHFLFFIVPMLNPDGVSRGHSRLDQFGNNLNRCYNNPEPTTQPTVRALRKVFEHLQRSFRERFIMYLDFHSHASQSSGFMFGNQLPPTVHHWNLFFPKLVELHARDVFSFALCRFGRIHMTSKDGASRVLFGNGLIHSYTVELTHFTDRTMYADTYAAMNNGGGVIDDSMAIGAAVVTAGGASSGPSSPLNRGTAAGGSFMKAQQQSSLDVDAAAAAGQGKKSTRSSDSVPSKKKGSKSKTGDDAASPPAAAKGTPTTRKAKGRRGAARREEPVAPPNATTQYITTPSVLCQSAQVGRACVLSLLDYCSAGTRQSPELFSYGGMNRVLLEVKRTMKQPKNKKRMMSVTAQQQQQQQQASPTSVEPIFKQY